MSAETIIITEANINTKIISNDFETSFIVYDDTLNLTGEIMIKLEHGARDGQTKHIIILRNNSSYIELNPAGEAQVPKLKEIMINAESTNVLNAGFKTRKFVIGGAGVITLIWSDNLKIWSCSNMQWPTSMPAPMPPIDK